MDAFTTTDIKARRGMPYGGMPREALLEKMEVTPEGPMMSNGHTGELAKDWQVAAILDRSPDPGYLASDEARRNPQHSRSILNLHYNTTRGSTSEAPRHPELFLGFTGNDPRGSQNIPRFDKLRGHTDARFRQLEVRMGDSVGHDGGPDSAAHQVAERPWTGPALQRARVEGQVQMRNRLKIFRTSRDGQSTGRNVVSDERGLDGVVRSRAAAASAIREQWASGDGEIAGSVLGYERTDDRGGDGREGFTDRGGPTGHGRGHDAQRGSQLGRLATPTADMAVARYSQQGRRGRTAASGSEAAREQRSDVGQQQELGRTQVGASTTAHRNVAIAMSAAAQSGRAQASRDAEGADAEWGSQEATTPARIATVGESDVAQAYFQARTDHEQGLSVVGRASVPGGAGSLAAQAESSGARQQMLHRAQRSHARSALALSMAQETRRGLSAPEAGDAVQAMYETVRTQTTAAQPGRDGVGMRGKSSAPSDNAAAGGGFDAARQQSSVGFQRAAAARELAVTNYKGAPTVVEATNLANYTAARGGMPIISAAMAKHIAGVSYSAKAPEYRGATQTSGAVDQGADLSGLHFGAHDESGFTGAVGMLATMRYDRLGAHENDTMVDSVGEVLG